MKWMIQTGSTPAERARLRVVYAMAGTVFFMPLNLFIMEGFFIIALGWGSITVKNIPNCPCASRRCPCRLSALPWWLSVSRRSPHFLLGTAFYAFTVLQYLVLYFGILLFVRHSWERRLLFSTTPPQCLRRRLLRPVPVCPHADPPRGRMGRQLSLSHAAAPHVLDAVQP